MMRGFDSIESMNSEELLVKRKRGSKRFLVAGCILGGAFFLMGILIGYFSHDRDTPKPKPTPKPSGLSADDYILQHVKKDFLKATIKTFSSKPRLAGTKDNYDLAKSIQSLWTSRGLENVHLDTYAALLSFPNVSNPNKVEIFNSTSNEAISTSSPFESPLRSGDMKSTLPLYNAFSPPGNVSGDVVYVNYGTSDDLQYLLKSLKIELTGKIFMIRMGKIFRSVKVRNAESFNASAVIMYSDPADVNVAIPDKEKSYPDSWWMPETAVQQGTLLDEGGTTNGLGYPSTDKAFIPADWNETLPKIPCQSISYGFALHILRNMSGPLAPSDWQGNLSTEYKVGPGWEANELKLRVIVNNYFETRPVNNVVGSISGKIEPDRYIILGSHHDSWSVGATDPHSGGAALTQIAAIFGDLLKMGYRPRRTLVFCSWDAEEPGSIGSTEWVKDNIQVLQQRAVAYLNLDFIAEGHFTFDVQSSPLLQDSIYDAGKKVPSPEKEFKTFFELWLKRPNINASDVEVPCVSYSFDPKGDHIPFYSQAGISSANIHTTFDRQKHPMQTYPLFHTGYDTMHLYENYQDPDLKYTVALTKLVAIWANDLANATLIPFKVTRLSSAVENAIQNLVKEFKEEWEKHDIEIGGLTSAVDELCNAAKKFEGCMHAEDDFTKIPFKLRMYNDQMMTLEKMFLNPAGVFEKPHHKNMLFCQDSIKTSSSSFFYSIRKMMDEIHKGNDLWQTLRQQVSLTVFFIHRAAKSLGEPNLQL